MVTARKSFSQALDTLITYLQSVQKDSVELDAIADELATAEAKLEATKADLTKADADLKSKSNLVDQSRKQASTDLDREILDKSNELKTLTEQVKTKAGELAEANVNVKNALAQHQTILDSLDSLRKKLA